MSTLVERLRVAATQLEYLPSARAFFSDSAAAIDRLTAAPSEERAIADWHRAMNELAGMRAELAAMKGERDACKQDAERWHMLMRLGTCFHDGPGFICDWIESRIWFHETDDKTHTSLQDYVDAAIVRRAEGERGRDA